MELRRIGCAVVLAAVLVTGPAWAGPEDPVTSPGPDEAPGLSDAWTSQLDAWHTSHLDPDRILDDAADGDLLLPLGSVSVPVRVERVPIFGSWAETVPGPGPASFRGHVAGGPGLPVLVTVTPAGVDGRIGLPGGAVHFEPVRTLDPDAPVGDTVIYRAADLRARPVQDLVVTHADDDGSAGTSGSTQASGGGTDRDRAVQVWADSDFTAQTNSSSRIANVLSRVSDTYWREEGWNLTLDSTVSCETEACDADRGMGSTDAVTLLREWAENASDSRGSDASWDMAHLFTGEDLDGGTIGAAYRPGRYGLSQMVDESRYDGSTNLEAAMLVAHETGHNFDGVHSEARTSTHTHNETFERCDLSIPFTGICVLSHEEEGQVDYDHFTLLWSSFQHEPDERKEVVEEFTDANDDRLQACNDEDYDAASFDAGSITC